MHIRIFSKKEAIAALFPHRVSPSLWLFHNQWQNSRRMRQSSPNISSVQFLLHKFQFPTEGSKLTQAIIINQSSHVLLFTIANRLTNLAATNTLDKIIVTVVTTKTVLLRECNCAIVSSVDDMWKSDPARMEGFVFFSFTILFFFPNSILQVIPRHSNDKFRNSILLGEFSVNWRWLFFCRMWRCRWKGPALNCIPKFEHDSVVYPSLVCLLKYRTIRCPVLRLLVIDSHLSRRFVCFAI
jgi:hypothetical protein